MFSHLPRKDVLWIRPSTPKPFQVPEKTPYCGRVTTEFFRLKTWDICHNSNMARLRINYLYLRKFWPFRQHIAYGVIVPDCSAHRSALFRWCRIGDTIGAMIGAIIDDNKEFIGDIFLWHETIYYDIILFTMTPNLCVAISALKIFRVVSSTLQHPAMPRAIFPAYPHWDDMLPPP